MDRRSTLGENAESTDLKDYYEERFSGGYMSYWSPLQRSRVHDVVAALPLREVGQALDFGCGQGVMTNEVKEALPPGWRVIATDLSDKALRKGAERYPDLTFEASSSLVDSGRKFDLVFTHHVLEYVGDLPGTLDAINHFVLPGGVLVHALPCGNAGSLEWNLCQRVDGGLESERGNRFFFEEDGHLRRLTSHELIDLLADRGFRLTQEFFAGHKWVAIEWISASHPRLVFQVTPIGRARGISNLLWLAGARMILVALNAARAPLVLHRRSRSKADLSPLGQWLSRVSRLLVPVSRPFDSWITKRAQTEWIARRSVKSGSEMYLIFEKHAV